jgi:hypothetical protein
VNYEKLKAQIKHAKARIEDQEVERHLIKPDIIFLAQVRRSLRAALAGDGDKLIAFVPTYEGETEKC